MKRITACILSIALILFPSGALSAPGSPSGTGRSADGRDVWMRVTADASCDDYNHVGNDWTVEMYVDDNLVARFANDKLVSEAPDVPLRAGEELSVRASVTEEDKYPDAGSAQQRYSVTQRDLEDGFTIDLEVSVAEKKGRYKGRKAVWHIRFTFARPSDP